MPVDAAGGVVWGVGVVLVGYLAGNSYAKVEKTFGQVAAVVVLAVVLIAIGIWTVRRHRRRPVSEPWDHRRSFTATRRKVIVSLAPKSPVS